MSEIRYRARKSAGSITIDRELEDGTDEPFVIRVRVMDHALSRQIKELAAQAQKFQKELETLSDEDQAMLAADKIDWVLNQINLLAINTVEPRDLDGVSVEDLGNLLQDMTRMSAASSKPGLDSEKKP